MLVYKATNTITGKAYVGLTETTLKKRITRHWGDRNKLENNKFKNALKKYGKTAFEWKILRECNTVEELNDYEIAYIAQYDTFHNGYNSTTGGFVGHMTNKKLNELSGVKLSEIIVGGKQRRSQSYKDNMSKAKKEWYASEDGQELCQKKSEQMTEYWASPEGQLQKTELSKKCGRTQQTKLDDSQIKEAFERWDKGESLNSLSKIYLVSRTTLKRYFQKHREVQQ